MRYRDVRSVLAFATLAAGCANGAVVASDPAYPASRGSSWVVVAEAPRQADLTAPTRQVGRLVASELSARWLNVLDRESLVQAHPALGPLLDRATRQLAVGEQPDPKTVEHLLHRHGVGQLLVVDVFRHEQVWGRETRIVRVGADARLVDLAEGRIVWQGRTDPETSGAPGSGFDLAAQRAARELVRLLCGARQRFADTPFATWPVLEYFTPN